MRVFSRLGPPFFAAFLLLGLASLAAAGLPFAPFSTCRISIDQYPPRPGCVANFEPDVVRLCPAGSSGSPVFDTVTFDLTICDALAQPYPNAIVGAYELSGTINIANGGATTATTDSRGKAIIVLSGGSGHGEVGVCAAGVLICKVNVRSPDVANHSLPTGCAMPTTGSSIVNSSDKVNTLCGFTIHFGPVTVGSNDAWDLNCDNLVNSSDTGGQLVPGYGVSGGWLQHFGHASPLGAKSTCP